MIKTNNNQIIQKLITRIISVNKKRNKFIIIGIALTTLLLTSVFSIGSSYIESINLQQLKLMGTAAHVAVTNVTEDQINKIKKLDFVKTIGLEYSVAHVKNSPKMGNVLCNLHWYDKTEWNKIKLPTLDNINGHYPEKFNEIMIPIWILNDMGIKNPQIGMEIPLQYYSTNNQFKKQTFILSGYFKDYVHIRTGNIDSLLVSKEFALNSNKTVTSNGAVSIIYKDAENIEKYNKKLSDILNLTDKQQIKPVPIYNSSKNSNSASKGAITAIIFFIMLTGYLLIYNIMYISISKDIRFYGLLKTMGTTPKQLKKIVIGQALRLSLIGISIGLILGGLLSLVVVPLALSIFLKTGIKISFSPLIFIGSAFFAFITTLISAFKPAKIVAKISPIEAIKFTAINIKKKSNNSFDGSKIHKMALRNIFRDRKRAAIVFLSLFLGLTTFITITCLITSLNTDNFIKATINHDFVLENKTLDLFNNDKKQIFDDTFFKKLEEIEEIKDIRSTSLISAQMEYDADKFSKHINWFCKNYHVTRDITEKDLIPMFRCYIVGIDSKTIKELNPLIDTDAFDNGEFAIIETDDPSIYSNVDNVNLTIDDNKFNFTIPIKGFIPDNVKVGGMGYAPNIYVSNKAIKNITKINPLVLKINIDFKNKTDSTAYEKIKNISDSNYNITVTSKLDKEKLLLNSKLMMFILGGGVSLILACIGLLNFINVMATSITVRGHELALLESIGMTKKQINTMLTLEGLGYASITLILVATFGNMISISIFKLFKQQVNYAQFNYPFIAIIIPIIIIFLICIITPKITYRISNKLSIIEKLRINEN